MKLPLLTFALCFALGIFVSLHFIPEAYFLPTVLVVIALGIVFSLFLRNKRVHTVVITLGLVIGMLWMRGYTAITFSQVEPLCGTEISATLELAEYPKPSKTGASCVVRMKGISGTMLYYGDASLMELAPGDTLRGTVQCYSVLERSGQRDFTYASKGILLRLHPVENMTVEQAGEVPLRYLPQELKYLLTCAVEKVFSENTGGFILALLTGDRDAMDLENSTDLEEAGLIHLTAVSGLHCGFLVAALTFLVGGNRFVRAAVSYPVLILYMLMVGCTPSVVRACVMTGLMLAAPVFDRESDPPTSLGAAALVILLQNPYAIASLSFQLSFAAVAGILCVSPRIYSGLYAALHFKRRWCRGVWSAAAMGISASLGVLIFTAPISAYYFRTVSLVSPLSNLFVLPVLQVLFAFALLLTVTYLFLPAAAVLSPVVELLAEYVLWVARVTTRIPGHAVSFLDDAMVMWLVLVYTLIFICLISKDGWRSAVLAVILSIISLFAVQQLSVERVKDNSLTVVSVDVGQGAATLLHSDGVTALVDCGSYYSQRGSGASVTDTMQLYGWNTLDYIVLTHYHEDHAGGLDELLVRMRVDVMLLPRATVEPDVLHDEVLELARRYGVDVQYIDEAASVPLGDARLTVYPQLTFGKVNEEGLTVLCSQGEFDLLITGDMGTSTERLLVEAYSFPDIEVLMVGHHGSKYSTSEILLATMMPEVGIISVGENSYGHPTEETLKRLSFYGCDVYRTDSQGNIIIQVRD